MAPASHASSRGKACSSASLQRGTRPARCSAPALTPAARRASCERRDRGVRVDHARRRDDARRAPAVGAEETRRSARAARRDQRHDQRALRAARRARAPRATTRRPAARRWRSASASAVARPTRTPVNDPGPRSAATHSSCRGRDRGALERPRQHIGSGAARVRGPPSPPPRNAPRRACSPHHHLRGARSRTRSPAPITTATSRRGTRGAAMPPAARRRARRRRRPRSRAAPDRRSRAAAPARRGAGMPAAAPPLDHQRRALDQLVETERLRLARRRGGRDRRGRAAGVRNTRSRA